MAMVTCSSGAIPAPERHRLSGVATPTRLAGRGVNAASQTSPEAKEPKELIEIAWRLARLSDDWGVSGSGQRRSELIVADPSVEAWVIAWPSGSSIELHDHGESCGAVAVRSGELQETSVAWTYSGELALRNRTLRTGRVVAFEGGHVHDVVNVRETEAISIHVYSPPLTSMTYYRVSDGSLQIEESVSYELGREVI